MVKALADCYNNARKWDTRRQILSYMADKASFETVRQYITRVLLDIALRLQDITF